MFNLIFSLGAYLPLTLVHAFGRVLGWLAYRFSGAYRDRFQENLLQAGWRQSQLPNAVGHAGKMVAELPRLWRGAPVPVRWEGAELIEAAHVQGKGVLFLTPHLGCFEITAQAYAQRYSPQGKTVTVLFRPPRKAWLQAIVARSRSRPGLKAAPTTLSGVKSLLKALKQGEAVGLLPDQVPPEGLGIWAPFFGRDAYTMTLPARLVQQTGAQVLLIWGERLSAGKGYCVHVCPLPQALSDNALAAASQINAAMELLITKCPEQYLWGYARYKQPRHEQNTAQERNP